MGGTEKDNDFLVETATQGGSVAKEDDPFALDESKPRVPKAKSPPSQPPVSRGTRRRTAAAHTQETAAALVWRPGSTIDVYTILEVVGTGGMGRVYKAHDQRLNRSVAIKTMRSSVRTQEQATQFRKRFRDEALIPAAISHPNIITVFDIGEHDGIIYFVMEFVENSKNLREIVKEANDKGQHIPLGRLKDYFLQTTAGLRALHTNEGLLHRDIKLENLLVYALPGGGEGVKIIDFGIAHKPGSELTSFGDMLGTASYMSPESFDFKDGKPVELDHRSDLFALGIVFYRCLTLKHPYPSIPEQNDPLKAAEIYNAREKAPPPSEHRSDLGPEWDAIIMRLLELDREKRYQTAAQLYDDLMQIDVSGAAVGTQKKEIVPSVPSPVAAVVATEPQQSPEVPPLKEAVASSAPCDSNDLEAPPKISRGAVPEPSLPTILKPKEPVVPRDAARKEPVVEDAPNLWRGAWENSDAARKKALAKVILALTVSVVVFAALGGISAWLDNMSQKRVKEPVAFTWPGDSPKPPADAWVSDVKNAQPLFPEARAPAHGTSAPTVAPEAVQAAAPVEQTPSPPKHARAEASSAPHAKPRTSSDEQPRPEAKKDPDPGNPWQQLYGTGAVNTGALVARDEGRAPTDSKAEAKGVRLNARLADTVASNPTGAPVVSVLTMATTLGAYKLPVGTEIHGKAAGYQGMRVMIQFEFIRLPDGSTISISGVARGRDGRHGIPGERVLGTGAAGSVATSAGAALIREAGSKMAEAAGDALGSEALREAGSNAGDKARRLDPDENVVIAKRNTSFVVYVEQVR